jgi:hypothetical protein
MFLPLVRCLSRRAALLKAQVAALSTRAKPEVWPTSVLKFALLLSPCRAALLKAEEEWVATACSQIAALKPDLVVTEKGLSDLAAHFLTKVGW